MTLLEALKASLAYKWEPAKKIPRGCWKDSREKLRMYCNVCHFMRINYNLSYPCESDSTDKFIPKCVLNDKIGTYMCCKEFIAVMDAKNFPEFRAAVVAMCERLEREITKLEAEK